jgi:hypothetical protein
MSANKKAPHVCQHTAPGKLACVRCTSPMFGVVPGFNVRLSRAIGTSIAKEDAWQTHLRGQYAQMAFQGAGKASTIKLEV